MASELWARTTGKEPMLTRDGLRMSNEHMYFSWAKAERVLGHRARPWQDAVADALAWYRARGRLA